VGVGVRLLVVKVMVGAGLKSMTLHDTFGNMAWIWMLTNNRQVEWVDMDPYGSISTFVEMNPRNSNLLT
jgi:tRNA G26 N,N-dimethylase Trm1